MNGGIDGIIKNCHLGITGSVPDRAEQVLSGGQQRRIVGVRTFASGADALGRNSGMQAAIDEPAFEEVVLEVLLGDLAGSHRQLSGDKPLHIFDHTLYVQLKFSHRLKGV